MRTPTRLAVSALTIALVALACSGDETSDTTVAASTTSTTVAPPPTTTTTTEAPTPGTGLAGLLDTYERTPIRTTYRFGDGGDTTTVILSQDPTADPPVEAVIIPEAGSKLITIGDESIFCDTASSQCFSIPGGAGDGISAGLLGPFTAGMFLAADLDAIPGADVTEEAAVIGGRDGLCFTFSPPAGAGFDTALIRQCVDADLGFTLLLQAQTTGSDAVETIMELVEVGDPLDDDFVPTGPVADTP